MSRRVRTRPYAVLAALALAVSPLVVAATPAAAATPRIGHSRGVPAERVRLRG